MSDLCEHAWQIESVLPGGDIAVSCMECGATGVAEVVRDDQYVKGDTDV